MNKISLYFMLPVLMVVPFLRADTIFLKDGSQYRGDIISEGPDGILIEYFATPSIKDQRTVPSTDIDRVERLAPDTKGFQELGQLYSPLTLLDTSFHDPLLDRKIPQFVKNYPYSSRLDEVKRSVETLEGERTLLKQGDRRIDGVWYTASEIASDSYQWESKLKYQEMKKAADSKNPVETLRVYELLEKEFPGSVVMPDGIDMALKQLDQLQGEVASARVNGDLEDKNRAKAIAAGPADQAKIIKDAVDREILAAKESIKQSTANGSKFFPVFQNSKESLDALQALVVAERTRLMQLQKTPMREGIVAATECARLIKQGKLKEAQEQLALSQKLWPINIDNTKLKASLEQANKQPSPKS